MTEEDDEAFARRINAEWSSIRPIPRARFFLERALERMQRVLASDRITRCRLPKS